MTEQLMDTISNEEHERLISISEHAISPPLSPAAQAVLDAFLGDAENTGLQMDDMRENVAAALRALAHNVYSDEIVTCGGSSYALVIERDDILAIADELEAHG